MNTPGAQTPARIPVMSHTPPTTKVDKIKTKNSPPRYLKRRSMVRLIGFDKSMTTEPGRNMFGMKNEVTITAIKIIIKPPTQLIKVTKPSSGDSGYGSGYKHASVTVGYQPNPAFERDGAKARRPSILR